MKKQQNTKDTFFVKKEYRGKEKQLFLHIWKNRRPTGRLMGVQRTDRRDVGQRTKRILEIVDYTVWKITPDMSPGAYINIP